MAKGNYRICRRFVVAVSAVALLMLIAGVIVWQMFVATTYDGEDPEWIYVGQNADCESLECQLESKLGHTGRRAATLMSLTGLLPSQVRGAYRFEPGVSAIDIYLTLRHRRQTPVKLTFNNVRTLPQLASRFDKALEADSAMFITAVNEVLSGMGVAKEQYIGMFMPDTYEFYWTASPVDVIERLVSQRNRFWTDDRMTKAANMGLSPEQVIVIASIAEEETNDRVERGVIGRLYANRFHKGMPLQACPTVKFALGDFSLKRITQAHLSVESPYNTYRVSGLPPGPIRMPAGATIDAILDATPNSYLYMCAKDDFSGKHNFASDYAAHQRNAERYRKALNKRGIH